MAFDVEGARKAGYSDAEIVDHLAGERNFDAAGARKSGYSDAEILGHLRTPMAPAGPSPDAPSRVGSMARGIVQGATFGLADELRAKTDALFGVQSEDASLAQSRGALRQDMATNPTGAVIGQIAGGVGGAIAGGAAAGALGVGRVLVNPLARTVAGGMAGGAATGFGEAEGGLGPRADAALEGAALGGAAGAVLHGGFGAVNRMLNPIRPNLSPTAQALRTQAQAEGIPMSVGQETGSKFMRNLESQLAQTPGASGLAADARLAQAQAFNRAALARAGENADTITPQVLEGIQQRVGGTIETLANRNTMRVTPDLDAQLARLEDELQFLPPEAAAPVRARLAQVQGMMQPDAANGGGMIIPGAAYRALDSQLSAAQRGTNNGDLRQTLRGLRENLRTAMDNSISPADAAEWQQARREYANYKIIQKAMGGAGEGTAEGNLSPLALRGAIGGERYAMGNADLEPLARLGQSVLRPPPDSGTAGRSLINTMLTGGGTAAGFSAGGVPGAMMGAAAPFVVPYAVQRVINSPAGRNWLINGLGQLNPVMASRGAVAVGSVAERNQLLQD